MSDIMERVRLAAAALMVAAWTNEPEERARLTLLEWLRDGFLAARADRVVNHRLIAAETTMDQTEDPLLQAIISSPTLAWDRPTEAEIEDDIELPSSFWSPIQPDHAHADFWASGRMTCADGDGTRARRIYAGLAVEKSQLQAAAELNGFVATARASPAQAPGAQEPAPPTDEEIRGFILDRMREEGRLGRTDGELLRALQAKFGSKFITRPVVQTVVDRLREEGKLAYPKNAGKVRPDVLGT